MKDQNKPKHSPLMKQIHDERRQGKHPRSKVWSPNGDRKDHKKNRKESKKDLKNWSDV